VEEDLLQGMHRLKFRLSVEEHILRRKSSRGTSSGGRVTRNIQREESFKVSQELSSKIHPGWIGIIPDCQIWESWHGELAVRYFGISEFGVFRSVEKWYRRS
jgi:hypothetical protein